MRVGVWILYFIFYYEFLSSGIYKGGGGGGTYCIVIGFNLFYILIFKFLIIEYI